MYISIGNVEVRDVSKRSHKQVLPFVLPCPVLNVTIRRETGSRIPCSGIWDAGPQRAVRTQAET
jgi:hypothetical protein